MAGPFTSIVFGILMLPVFIVTKNVIVLLLCLMPIAMGVMCIIPMKMKTGFNRSNLVWGRRGYLSYRIGGTVTGFF